MILSIHILKNICRPAVAGDGGGYQLTRVYRLTGCDGWPYPSQSSTVGGEKHLKAFKSISKAKRKQGREKEKVPLLMAPFIPPLPSPYNPLSITPYNPLEKKEKERTRSVGGGGGGFVNFT